MTRRTSIILICIVIISLAISIYIPNRKKIEEEDITVKYSIIEVDKKIGVKDQEENIIIEPMYEKIIIPNQHRAVFLCENAKEQKVINDKNNEIFEKYDKVQAIEITDEKYEENILIYEKEGKLGLLEITGNIITDAKYEEISSLRYKNGELLVKQDGKYGILEQNGKSKIKNKYDEIQLDEYYTEENEYKESGYIVKITTEEGYRYGYYDSEGVKVLSEEYNEIARLTDIRSNNIYLIVSKNGQSGVFLNNAKIINTEYQSINYNPDLQMFIVEKTGRFGAINLKGVEILETKYSSLNINGIYIYAVKDEEQQVFDENGKQVEIPFDTIITSTSSSKYFIRNDSGNYSIIDSKFKRITNQNYNYIEYAYDTYFIVTNAENKVGMIDIDENIKVEFDYDLIQLIKGKSIIQALNFSTNKTDIYDNEFDLALEMTNANIDILDNGIKVYNNEIENYLDNNGKFITK